MYCRYLTPILFNLTSALVAFLPWLIVLIVVEGLQVVFIPWSCSVVTVNHQQGGNRAAHHACDACCNISLYYIKSNDVVY